MYTRIMENEDNDLAVILDEIDAIPSEKELNQRVEEILKEAGGVRKIKDKTLYTFDEAIVECERMNVYSKEFWLENKYNIWDCEHYMNIRATNPKAPSDGYAIHWGFDYAYRQAETGKVHVAASNVLAGDGRARNEDGTLYEIPEFILSRKEFSVDELDYIFW